MPDKALRWFPLGFAGKKLFEPSCVCVYVMVHDIMTIVVTVVRLRCIIYVHFIQYLKQESMSYCFMYKYIREFVQLLKLWF